MSHNKPTTSRVPTPAIPQCLIIVALVVCIRSCLLVPAINAVDSSAGGSQQEPPASGASCFGGLQTFEKISMSSFESPQQGQQPSSFGGSGGILIQQDDQALTSECVNLCKSQSNCLSFVIDYNKFECKSYATTQLELQQELYAKYQAARAAASNSSTSGGDNFQESPSELNIQHLLPATSSNYFEKICMDGVESRDLFNDICGQGRLWTIERVVDSFLDGFVEKEVTNVNNKDECSKLCIFERQFVCRSADYDQNSRLCRLSKEDRRTQPQAMRKLAQSGRQYLENQCAAPGPTSCVYETRKNLGIISMDALKFAQTLQDCRNKCNQEPTFNCRSYSYHQQRCFLSGDDGSSLNSNLVRLPTKPGWLFGEKKCLVELCTKGIFTYEKISGHVLRSSQSSPIDLMMHSASSLMRTTTLDLPSPVEHLTRILGETNETRLMQLLPAATTSSGGNLVSAMMRMAANSNPLVPADPMHESASTLRRQKSATSNNLAITGHCRQSCDLGYLNCPAFTIDYKNNRCQRLDRNSQGRDNELVAQEGFSYYEKICLRVPEIMSMCQDKYWIFERVIGYELAPRFYERVLKFVQSRRDCEEYCLEEKQFQCRSALYNDEVSECKLSSLDRRLVQLEGGYFRNFNPKISYLENQCIRDQAPPPDTKLHCSYERARDEPAYPTYTELIEMVPPTPRVSTTTSGTDPLVDQLKAKAAPQAYCEQLCNDNTRFQCHSFGYYASTAQCFLSGDDSVSVGTELASSPSTGFAYYERKCRMGPIRENSSFIESNTHHQDKPTNPYFRPQNTNGGYAPALETTRPPASNISIHIDQRLNMFHSTTTPIGGSPTSASTLPPADSSIDANQYKCGIGHTFVYQRVSGFEPIGGYLTLLVRNHEQPGIVAECSDHCKRAYECRAFVVDYNSNQCYAMLENSSVGLLSLRQTLGKDYFEGFCVADHLLLSGVGCRNRTWIVDKILDQAVFGVQHQKLIQDSDRAQCRQACLEERLFWCKSAMFDGATNECKLYSVDRESMPQMRLLFTKGVDFYENQCQISSNACPYDPLERDMTIVTLTKSLQARSTFDCELACNSELTFNCRSYTFMDQQPGLPNLCLLSSDSRSTSQKGSVRQHHHTLYAERNCYFRRPRYPVSSQPLNSYSSSADPYSPTSTAVVVPPASEGEREQPTGSEQPALGSSLCEPHQYTFERTFGYDLAKQAPRERLQVGQPGVGVAIACQQECLRRGDRCHSFVVDYSLPYQSCALFQHQAGANNRQLVKSPGSAYFEKVCLIGGRSLAAPEVIEHVTPGQEVQADDIAPSYSNDAWQPQTGAHHLSAAYQQQQQQPAHLASQPGAACSKLWQFERFIGHNFTIQSDRVYEQVLSRMDCEIHCMAEVQFVCRSATYHYSTRTCRLFKNTRRSFMSHFVDLEQPSLNLPTAETSSQATTGASPDIITEATELLIGTVPRPTMDTGAITTTTPIATPTTGSSRKPARLVRAPEVTAPTDIDYLENTCVPEPASCQYRPMYDLFSPYIDKISHAVSLSDCQRQCDLERLFSCKSINYDPSSRNCMLINEDLISVNRGQQHLLARKNSIYSEKGNCEMISVQCKPQEMLVLINFDAPFRGRIMAKGNPEQCFMLGEGQTSLQFPIVFGPKCNSRQEGYNTFVNELVIQQHPVVMTDSDKTVRVMCAFEAPDQMITLKNSSSRDNKTQGAIDVGAPEAGRQRHDKQQFSGPAVVSNKASPPSVILRILEPTGRDATAINLGDDLVLKIQMQVDGQNSALGIFARNLAARSSNGDTLLLIDNAGCPVDQLVFPALEIDPSDGKSLYSNFKAFRFPSSGQVNFEVQIKFCAERCQPVDCSARSRRTKSYGRRRKRRDVTGAGYVNRVSLLQSLQPTQAVDSLVSSKSTLMKPGRAFQFVRELLALNPKPALQEPTATSSNQNTYDSSTYITSPDSVSVEPNQIASQEVNTGNEFSMFSSTPEPSHQPSNDAFQVYQKSILMHVDEKVVPSMVAPPVEPSRDIMDQRTQLAMAPYGRYTPPSPAEHYQEPTVAQHNYEQSPSQSEQPVHVDRVPPMDSSLMDTSSPPTPPSAMDTPQDTSISTLQNESPQAAEQPLAGGSDVMMNQPAMEPAQPSSPSDSEPQFTPSQSSNDANQDNNNNNNNPQQPNQEQAQGQEQAQDKNVPVRFSILVGENQPANSSPSETGSWQPVASVGSQQQAQLPVNASLVTGEGMDHVVVPGRGGQLEQNVGDLSKNTIGTAFAQMSTNTMASGSFGGASKFQHQSTYSDSPSNHLNSDTSKRSAVYEQTFDALPSNSIAAEVRLNQELAQIMGGPGRVGKPMATAAKPDCVNGADANMDGRMWSLAVVGTLVIVLNICVVVAGLFLYLRKAHFRHQHDIMRDTSDCSMNDTQRRRRWPSVLLKSKNNLGTTSINTHEHFFCKLNSDAGSITSGANQRRHDPLNSWQNMHHHPTNSTSNSTVSSKASPLPVVGSSVRINQQPRPQPRLFDPESSLNRSQLCAKGHKSILEVHSSFDNSDKLPSSYLKNLNHPDM